VKGHEGPVSACTMVHSERLKLGSINIERREVAMPAKAMRKKQVAAAPRKHRRGPAPSTKRLTIHDLGWTRERAREVRAKLASFAVDWDDPSMDVYNEA
jgi:hypothetical protein